MTESGELLARLQAETDTAVIGVVANRLPAVLGPKAEVAVDELAEVDQRLGPVVQLARSRHRQAAEQEARIADFGLPILRVDDQPGAAVATVLAAVRSAVSAELPASWLS